METNLVEDKAVNTRKNTIFSDYFLGEDGLLKNLFHQNIGLIDVKRT